MAETIKQMRERHEREITELQKQCKHPELTGWLREEWAPAHGTGRMVKCCKVCGEIVESRGQTQEDFPAVTPLTAEELEKAYKKAKGGV